MKIVILGYSGSGKSTLAKFLGQKYEIPVLYLDKEFIWWILYEGRTAQKRKQYRDLVRTYKDKTVVIKKQRELDRFRLT